VLPVQAADYSDLLMALVRAHPLAFWVAMLWASTQRASVKHLFSEDLHDSFALQGVTFINPFKRANDPRSTNYSRDPKVATMKASESAGLTRSW